MSGSLTHERGARLLLIAFAAIATLYSLVTPIFEGYDEDSHFAFVQHVATGRGLPRQPASEHPHLAKHEANQPPLYYLLAAPFVFWIDTSDLPERLTPNPHAHYYPVPYRDNLNAVLHRDDEGFPWQGTVLAVHLARLLSVLLGVGSLACTYALTRTLYPAEPRVALAATALQALIPSYLFSSGLVNNDGLVTFLCGLCLLQLARLWRAPFALGGFVTLGGLLGLTALSKLSGLWMLPFAAVVIATLGLRRRRVADYVKGGIVAMGLAALVAGWWYARNWVYYRDATGLNVLFEMIGRRPAGFSLADFLPELEGVRWSFWALFGWFNVPLPEWLYRVYDAALLAGLAGLALHGARAARARNNEALGALALAGAWFAIICAAFVNLNLMTIVAAGRLLFPALASIAVLLARGFLEWLPAERGWARWTARGAVAAMLALAVAVPFAVIAPVYAIPEMLTAEQARSRAPQALNMRIGGEITLLGAALETPRIAPGETAWVTLCWRAITTPKADYTLFVQLLADGDLIAAQKDTYHGLGNFPTTRWRGDDRFCERVPLAVRDTTPDTPSTALVIGMYGADGTRLAVTLADGHAGGDHVRLEGPAVQLPAGAKRLAYEWGHVITLTDYRLEPATVAPGGVARLTLNWRYLQPPSVPLAASVQVMDERGVRVSQSDAGLEGGAAGAAWDDARTLRIPAEVKPGVYTVRVGVYEAERVRNLPYYRGSSAALGKGLMILWQMRVQ